MPTLKDKDIKGHITAGHVRAVTLDTSVFDQFGCNLGYTTLRKLDQFKGTEVAVIFSEIVAREVKVHITEAAEISAARLRGALKKYRKRWRLEFDQAAKEAELGLDQEPASFAADDFSNFVQTVGAEVVPVDGAVSLPDLLDRYFSATAPFSRNDGKKNEFPDAFALMSLETWAERQDTLVMALSRDKDWMHYAARSARLFCVRDINQGLDYFHQEDRFVATRVVAKLREKTAPELAKFIDTAIQASLDDLDFKVDGDAAFDYEYAPQAAALQYWQFPEQAKPFVVASDKKSVTFSVEISALVDFTVEFSIFFVEDSNDKSYVDLGSFAQSAEKTVTFPVVVTVMRKMDPEPEVVDVEVTGSRIEVYFSNIDAGWCYEE